MLTRHAKRSSFAYLVCTTATIALFNVLGVTSEENLYVWIPVATNCGVFVGLGTKDFLKWMWICVRNLLLRLVAGFSVVIRDEGSVGDRHVQGQVQLGMGGKCAGIIGIA